jgi:hypothetical protein
LAREEAGLEAEEQQKDLGGLEPREAAPVVMELVLEAMGLG